MHNLVEHFYKKVLNIAYLGVNPLINPLISRCENLKINFIMGTSIIHDVTVHFHRQSTREDPNKYLIP